MIKIKYWVSRNEALEELIKEHTRYGSHKYEAATWAELEVFLTGGGELDERGYVVYFQVEEIE